LPVELGKRLEDEFEENEDDTCEVDCVPNAARHLEVTHALVTASSAAGHCSALLLSGCSDA